MQVYNDLKTYIPHPEAPLVLVLGNFDGMHLGHQALMKSCAAKAQSLNGISAAMTFYPHPNSVLKPGSGVRCLTDLRQKLSLIQSCGIQSVFLVPFTLEFSKIDAEVFVEKILVNDLKMRVLYVGERAAFGRGRRGNAQMMHSLSRKLGFQFECMKSVEAEGLEVSSSSVRELIDAGEFTKAAACLGRPFTFFSQVIAGKGLGRQIGFPTANLDTASQMMPPRGVYAVKARKVCVLPAEDALFGDCIHLKSQAAPDWMPGVMNYGCRPTVSSVQELCAEIHFPKFSGNLLGETLEVLIIKRVRDEIKFDTVADLKRQIEKDILVSQSWA